MIPLNCRKLEKAEKHVECWERALLLPQLPATCPRAGLENTEEGFSTCALQYLKIAITLHSSHIPALLYIHLLPFLSCGFQENVALLF